MSETRELIEGMKAAKELTDAFREARDKIQPIQEMFNEAITENDQKHLLDGIYAVSELDIDMAQGGLIVMMGVMARIREGLNGTECYDKVKELFAPKAS